MKEKNGNRNRLNKILSIQKKGDKHGLVGVAGDKVCFRVRCDLMY